MTSLAKQLPLFPDETLTNYCARLAAAYELPSAREFGHYIGFNFQSLTSGCTTDIEIFMNMIDLDQAMAENALIKRLDRHRLRVRGEIFSPHFFNVRHERFCVRCLGDDELTARGPRASRGFIRMSWLPNFVCSCEIHGVSLTTAPQAREQSIIGDFYLRRRSSSFDLEAMSRDLEISEPGDLEIYFLKRFRDRSGNGTWMDAYPLQSICHLSELIGLLDMHGPTGAMQQLSVTERKLCGTAGYNVLLEGEAKFRDRIGTVAERYFNGRSLLGPKALFGALATDMMAYAFLPGYQSLLDIMQDAAMRKLPIGPGDNFFGPVKTRELHSVATARKIYKIGKYTMVTHLMKNGLIAPDSDPDFQSRLVFPAALLDSAMTGVGHTIAILPARTQLGATRKELNALVAAGSLTQVVLTSINGKSKSTFYNQTELDRCMAWLRLFDIQDEHCRHATLPLRAMKMNGVLAIRLLAEGKLASARLLFPEMGLAGLYLNESEWGSARAASEKMAKLAVANFLLTAPKNVRFLVERGYLQQHPMVARDKTHYFDRASIENFAAKYANCTRLAVMAKTTELKVLQRIERKKMKPIIPALAGTARTGFYRISDFIAD